MKRAVSMSLFILGLAAGLGSSMWWPERVAAQVGWECRSWTIEQRDDATPIGTWLGGANDVQLTTAGLSAGSRYAVVACKR